MEGKGIIFKREDLTRSGIKKEIGQNKSTEDKCFRCGGKGHWSRLAELS